MALAARVRLEGDVESVLKQERPTVPQRSPPLFDLCYVRVCRLNLPKLRGMGFGV